jgi:DNA-binding PadR family transcriptional regulator
MLGTFEQMVLLAILHVGDDAYGPLILEKLQQSSRRTVSRGSLYVTLDRLERKEMLRSIAGDPEPERGGRPKRYVSVTEKGVAALREARDSLTSLWSGLDTVLGK